MKNRLAKTIPMALALILMLTMAAGCPAEEPPAPLVGHIHITRAGGFRDTMASFIKGQFDEPVELYVTCSGDLRDYMTVALEKGRIERGTIFSHNHRQVHQQFEAARPFIAEFPDRYTVREEFAALADPLGELHLVWVDAFVIIYNADLISHENVPSTWEELSHFEQPIGLITKGCLGGWGLMAFYHHLGEENFIKLVENAEVKGKRRDVSSAVKEGTVAVGVASLLDVLVRDGKVGVIWPEDGAIARPAFLVIPDEPTEYHLRLADIIMSREAAELFAREFNMASALPGGPVPAIVEENNFHFVFIPAEAIICLELEARVDQIVGR
ncbi:ABC transporter substrate-binding protein [Dehalococcoidia bacterium]|nr:ABC transporter substrate-binding protein [Dehalococcoidia bacterium]MCL0091096.1 ABC transporter substrate-binding protein [Dehalococcoidia bacterium]